MRRCYLGAALVLGTLISGFASFNSCGAGTLTVYAAENALTEEMEIVFQEEVQTGEENVETETPEEEAAEVTAEQPAAEEAVPAEPVPQPAQVAGSSFSLEEQEYQVLLKIVEAEAGGEDTTGKMLVANVIMNRVRSGIFPGTVTEVVYQTQDGKAQFSSTADGRIDQVSISQDTVDAVARVMNGEDCSGGALFFRSVNSSSGWFDQSLNRVLEHGNHIFYTL